MAVRKKETLSQTVRKEEGNLLIPANTRSGTATEEAQVVIAPYLTGVEHGKNIEKVDNLQRRLEKIEEDLNDLKWVLIIIRFIKGFIPTKK